MKIAIDVGGVLIEKSISEQVGEDTVFNPNDIQWVPGALDAIRTLATSGHILYILSFCGKRREMETRIALKTSGVDTWINESNWFFVRNRRLKAPCMKEHNLELLIDDTHEVVKHCRSNDIQVLHFRSDTNAIDWPSVINTINTL